MMRMGTRGIGWQEGIFWLAFAVMVVGMFGFRGIRAQQVVTVLAALIVVMGAAYVMRRSRRVGR